MSVFWRARNPQPAGVAPRWPAPSYSTGPLAPESGYADVSIWSPESAMRAIAVRTAIDLIASLLSELPLEIYRGQGRERKKVPIPGYLDDPAGDGQGREDWAYGITVSFLTRGNLFAEILERGPGGQPTQLSPFHPDEVTGHVDVDGSVLWTAAGSAFPPERMFHRRVNALPGRVFGLSPIAAHAAQIGLDLTATRFGAQWFADGAHPTGLLSNEVVSLDEGQAKAAKDRFVAMTRGRREPLVLGQGWKYAQIQVNAEESQFLATAAHSAAECARMFGPGVAEIMGYTAPGGAGGNLTYANVESRSRHLLIFSENKWIRRVERIFTDMLPRPQWAQLNRDALLEMTTLDRFNVHQIALRNGIEVVNEVREIEDLPPVPWGDKPFTIPSGAANPTPGDPQPPPAQPSQPDQPMPPGGASS